MTQNELAAAVRQILGISSGNDDFAELYVKLKQYRNGCHPDKTTDGEEKKRREEAFKGASQLLEEMEIYLKGGTLERLPAKIAKRGVVKPIDIEILIRNRRLEDEVLELRSKNETLTWEVEQLRDEIEKAKKVISTKAADIVRQDARPRNTPQRVTLGISGVLAIAIGMSKDLFGLLDRVQGYDESTISIVRIMAFTVFVGCFWAVLAKERRLAKINKSLDNLFTAVERTSFVQSMAGIKVFSDTDVAEYIQRSAFSKRLSGSYLLSWRRLLPGRLNRVDIEHLSQAFISRLLEEGMAREIGISECKRYYDLTDNSTTIAWHLRQPNGAKG